MKLQNLKENLSKQFEKLAIADLLASLEEVSNRWSSGIFTGVRLMVAMISLVLVVATVIIGTQYFIAYFGTGTFIFTLIVSSFVMSVLITFSSKQQDKK